MACPIEAATPVGGYLGTTWKYSPGLMVGISTGEVVGKSFQSGGESVVARWSL